MKDIHLSSMSNFVPYTADETFELIIDLALTIAESNRMRLGTKNRKADIYHSYHVIEDAK